MKKKQLGFTMVELLATIVIIGILSTIGIVTVTNLRNNQEQKHDQTQKEVFRQTAKTYFTDKKSHLPYEPMQTKKVTLNQLIEENYIDSLLNYHKKSYDKEKSYVTVRLLGNGIYAYNVYLEKDGTLLLDEDPNTSTIQYAFNNFATDYDDNNNIHYINNTTSNAKVNITITDVDGIAAYKYTITSTKTKKESEYIYVKDQQQVNDNIYLNKNDYEDGKYKITITVWDINGYKKTQSSEQIFLDTKNPTCSVKAYTQNETGIYNVSYTSGTWTNKDVKVTASCNDGDGSGCTSSNSTVIFPTDTTIPPFYDKAGNVGTCNNNIDIKIDKELPTCGDFKVESGTEGNNGWYTTNIELSVGCNDTGGSQCAASSFTTTATTEGNINRSIIITDKAGNPTTCKKKYKIDRHDPKCGDFEVEKGTEGNDGWYISDVELSVECTDEVSDCTKETFTGTISTEGTSSSTSITIKDKAGREASCPSRGYKIDKTAPTVVCEYKGDASNEPICTEESLKYYYNCTYNEQHSGIASAVFEWGSNDEIKTKGAYSSRNTPISIPKETLCMLGDSQRHVTYTNLCDKAGNCMPGLPKTWN